MLSMSTPLRKVRGMLDRDEVFGWSALGDIYRSQHEQGSEADVKAA